MITERVLQNLTAIMDEKALTMADLARGIGISQPSVSNWWRKNTVPTVPMLEKLSVFLKVDPSYFFLEPGTQKTHGEIEKPQDEVDELIELVDECAERVLSELDLKQYRSVGGHRAFGRNLKRHYNGEGIDLSDWFMFVLAEFNKFTTVDLRQKLNEILNKKNPGRQKAIDDRKALEAKKNGTF